MVNKKNTLSVIFALNRAMATAGKARHFIANTRSKAASVFAVCAIALPIASWAAPVISPFAAGLPSSAYSASANYAGYLGSSAESAFNGGYWNAGSQGPDWIQADMGETKTLSMVKVKYGGSYIGSVPAGTSNFFIKVYLSDNPIGNSWSSLTPVASILPPLASAIGQQDLYFASPASGRYLEIVVNYSNLSWVAVGDTKGAQTWTDPISASPVPLPGSAVLLTSGILAVWTKRRRRLLGG